MFRQAVGSLLARRFSPRAIPRTAPARSLHSFRDLPINDLAGAAAVAATALAAAGALAVQYFKKAPAPAPVDDDSAAGKSEEEMKAMFEDWVKKYNRVYRDEEEKAMRFQVFKQNIKWIESKPPALQKKLLPPNRLGDRSDEELPSSRSCIANIDDPNCEEYRQEKFLRENKNGYKILWKPGMTVESIKAGGMKEAGMKEGDKQAT